MCPIVLWLFIWYLKKIFFPIFLIIITVVLGSSGSHSHTQSVRRCQCNGARPSQWREVDFIFKTSCSIHCSAAPCMQSQGQSKLQSHATASGNAYYIRVCVLEYTVSWHIFAYLRESLSVNKDVFNVWIKKSLVGSFVYRMYRTELKSIILKNN